MKVRELLDLLSHCNPDSDVLCYLEDGTQLQEKPSLRVLAIESVVQRTARKERGEDQCPRLVFESSELASDHVLLDVTSDF
jgi:hypothetical protein